MRVSLSTPAVKEFVAKMDGDADDPKPAAAGNKMVAAMLAAKKAKK